MKVHMKFQIHKLSHFTLTAVIALLAFVAVNIPAPKAHAAISSDDIAATIRAKCDQAIYKWPEAKKDEDLFKQFDAACIGKGTYAKNATERKERAYRLLIICSANFKPILENANRYRSGGPVLGGDCGRIATSKELRHIAQGAYNGAILPYEDPSLDCAASPDSCDLMKKYINPIISFLAALVGLAVTIGIISGGIRYATAGDDPQKVSAGKTQIRGAIIALLTFIFLYAAIRWLVPGDVL
jgi:hypothetical protein